MLVLVALVGLPVVVGSEMLMMVVVVELALSLSCLSIASSYPNSLNVLNEASRVSFIHLIFIFIPPYRVKKVFNLSSTYIENKNLLSYNKIHRLVLICQGQNV